MKYQLEAQFNLWNTQVTWNSHVLYKEKHVQVLDLCISEAKLPDIIVQVSHALASLSLACQEYGKELKT